MSPAEQAHRDQVLASLRETERRNEVIDHAIQRGALVFLSIMALFSVYAFLAVAGYVPAAPWSPLAR